jgi:hypothetical protein
MTLPAPDLFRSGFLGVPERFTGFPRIAPSFRAEP